MVFVPRALAVVVVAVFTQLPAHAARAATKRLCYEQSGDLQRELPGRWVRGKPGSHIWRWNLSCPFDNPKYSCVNLASRRSANGRDELSAANVANLLQRAGNSIHSTFVPHDCHLRMFHPGDFVRRLSGRKLWFAGDSLSRQHFISLACSTSHFIKEKGRRFDNLMPNDWLKYANDGEVQFFPFESMFSPYLEKALSAASPRDIIVYNLGIHHSAYVHGQKLSELAQAISSRRGLLGTFPGSFIYRETSQMHFPHDPKGEYHRQGKPYNHCHCATNVTVQNGYNKAERMHLLTKPGIPISFLPTFDISSGAGAMNVDVSPWTGLKLDCQHFCQPGGPPGVYTQVLYNMMHVLTE